MRCSTPPEEVGCFSDSVNIGPASGFVLKQPDGSFRMIYTRIEEVGSFLYHHIMTGRQQRRNPFRQGCRSCKACWSENPLASHQLLNDFPGGSEIVAVTEDPYAPAFARYKMLVAIMNADEQRLYNRLLISPDTVHWTMIHTVLWHSRGTEPLGSCCYDIQRHEWLIATRPDWGDRRIAMRLSARLD